MGDLLPFRRKRRKWTAARDYGVRAAPEPAKFWRDQPKRVSRWRTLLRALRPLLLLVLLAAAWVFWRNPELVGAPDLFASEPQRIAAQWTRCGYGRGHYCVVDGDSFRIGDDNFRLLGLDAPELEARCPAEAAGAEAATRGLHDWLNAGALVMQGRIDEPTDRYGRGLRELYREEDAKRVYASETLIEAGLAREYYGGTRESWCG